jgi:antirestriction protein ArdC
MTMTPVEVEARLSGLVTEMTQAQRDLAKARDAETQAEIAYKRAKARAFHHSDCPHVSRGGHTVADRDAWIDTKVMDEWAQARVATTAREVAQDNLRVVLAVAETMRSLGVSVRSAYSLAGAS